MSITNDDELKQALAALETLRLALAALKRDVGTKSRSNFAILAEGTIDEIERIQQDVDTYLGLDDLRAHLWMRVTGPSLEMPDAPSSVLTAVLDALRKGLQAATEHAYRGALTTRPTSQVQRAVDVRVAVVAEGSLRIGLNIELPPQQELEPVPGLTAAAQDSLADYLDAASWAADEAAPDDALEQRVPDLTRRRLLLQQLLSLAPRAHGAVDSIELRGRLLGSRPTIVLRRATRRRLTDAIDRTDRQRVEECVGELREIDLDKRLGIVRARGEPDVQCEFVPELMPAAYEALGRFVRVYGLRPETAGRRQHTLLVTRLDIIEDDSQESRDTE
ncbi:MAG: hypothetical protein IT378_14355 [Sandaracinaceae bacterium]|nr:hypothetical protein [Sandaracinaceae bacterium]